MGNWKSAPGPLTKVRYEVVLPPYSKPWNLLYSGDIETWDAVAVRYGMDKYAYLCGMPNCDREAVCLRYARAQFADGNKVIYIKRYKRPTLKIPISKCPTIHSLLNQDYELNEVVAAVQNECMLLVLNHTEEFTSNIAFSLIHRGVEAKLDNCKKDTEKIRLWRRGSSKKSRMEKVEKGKSDTKANELFNGESKEKLSKKDSDEGSTKSEDGTTGPQCLGVHFAPRRDMTVIHCQISPDLSQTAVLFYSLSPTANGFCYDLHLYCNIGLQQENGLTQLEKREVEARNNLSSHLLRHITLNREVQPHFVFDPRYRTSRIAVANYEAKDLGISHELVVLSLAENVSVEKRGKLSLPILFGSSRFNLLYSKDGELLILQKLTDDRFGVTSFCDIYIFSSDALQLIKYMTASLPGLFYICKVSYEPVFSRCGSYMRVLDHRVGSRGRNCHGSDEKDDEPTMEVHIYQLPRVLNLMSQCRIIILQQLHAEEHVSDLPLPNKLLNYLRFGPLF